MEASEFGTRVHWNNVPWETGIKRCLCGDHNMRGLCVHTIVWLWTHEIVSPPVLWEPSRMQEKNDARGRGRDPAFVPGSARQRDQLSQTAVEAMHRATQQRRNGTGGNMPQAVLFSQGCLKGWADSVRKNKTTRPRKQSKRSHRPAPVGGVAAGAPGGVASVAAKHPRKRSRKCSSTSTADVVDSCTGEVCSHVSVDGVSASESEGHGTATSSVHHEEGRSSDDSDSY
jgi:hypothetical protein